MNVVSASTVARKVEGPGVRVFRKRAPFEEGCRAATSEKLIVASSLRLTLALPDRDSRFDCWGKYNRCWSGTFTAYTKPGRKFGPAVEWLDSSIKWIMPVPEEYRNVRDGILVVEHPNYTIERDGNSRIIRASQVDIVEQFPQTGGDCRWYETDPKHGIPQGRPVQTQFEGRDVRQLLRNGQRVGPIVRTIADTGVSLPYLELRESPSAQHVIMVEQ